MFASGVFYAGLIFCAVGALTLLKPLKFLGIGNRKRAALVLALGFIVAASGLALPSSEVRVTATRTRLDEFFPVYQFNEVHSIRIRAPRERVYQAVKEVSADEILFFRTLTWLRRFGRRGPESIMNAPGRAPILEVATRTTFLVLAEETGREFVVGTEVFGPPGFRGRPNPTPEEFKALREPGFALAGMNFVVEEAGPNECVVTTETRVYATDDTVRRIFARYWRVIYPGSSLLRYSWLRAIKRRAESSESPAT